MLFAYLYPSVKYTINLKSHKMININKLVNLMEQRNIAEREDITGIDSADIQELEHYFGLSFPATYVQFLQHFGHSAGYLSPWMTIYFNDLKSMRTQFELLLATQTEETTLPQNALIIGNWESIFDYIICGNNPDPMVYRLDLFNHNTHQTQQYADSYSSYLKNMIESADTSSIPSDFFDDIDTLTALDASP